MRLGVVLFSLLLSAPSGAASHRLHGKIDEDSVKSAINFLETEAKHHAKAVVLEIDSPGGYVNDGFELALAIESSPTLVVCVVDGEAASAAFFVLQSCDERVMTKRSRLMTHEPYWVLMPGRYGLGELKQLQAKLEVMRIAFAEHCAHRLSVTFGEYLKRTDGKDWDMSWRDALRYTAVDAVVKSVEEVLDTVRDLT